MKTTKELLARAHNLRNRHPTQHSNPRKGSPFESKNMNVNGGGHTPIRSPLEMQQRLAGGSVPTHPNKESAPVRLEHGTFGSDRLRSDPDKREGRIKGLDVSETNPLISTRSTKHTVPLQHYSRDKLRSIAYGIPEAHFIGEICKGDGFKGYCLSCKWSIQWGKQTWSLLEGAKDGLTQYAMNTDDKKCIWNHPIDVHFTTASMQGWPRIIFQVWNLDTYGRSNLMGYGFAHLPLSAGT